MRHAAAELCLLVSQGAHDRIRQALHLAADNCTLARFPKAVESSRWLDGGRGWGARAGGMTGLDRRRSFVCQPEFHGRLGEMSERVVAIIAVAIIAGSVSLSWGCCTVLVWRRLLLLRVVVPWASQFSTS